jgi:ATP-dependent DNA helicase RecG
MIQKCLNCLIVIESKKRALRANTRINYESSGFWVVFRKDTYNEQSLKEIGLNNRQVKAVMYVKEKGKITNAEYQEINKISRQMATNELHNLAAAFKLLINKGHGAGSYFELVN